MDGNERGVFRPQMTVAEFPNTKQVFSTGIQTFFMTREQLMKHLNSPKLKQLPSKQKKPTHEKDE